MACITLLSDFGTQDAYAAVMKGVILSINPGAVTVDITHDIAPQDVLRAAFTIYTAYSYFPPGSIHVCVVDPGVGSPRAVVAMMADNHVFLAPDNGLLSYIALKRQIDLVVKVENDHFFLPTVSRTFHGRDIFAPVAAHVSLNVPLTELGPESSVSDCQRLPLPEAKMQTPHSLSGTIVLIDRFGNLISNIDHRAVAAWLQDSTADRLCAELNGKKVCGLVDSYAAVELGRPLLVIGSHGFVEIAVNCDSARAYFRAQRGDHFKLWLNDRWPEESKPNQDERHDQT